MHVHLTAQQEVLSELWKLSLLWCFSVGFLKHIKQISFKLVVTDCHGEGCRLPPPRWLNHNERVACQMHNTDKLIEICCRKPAQINVK